MFRSLTEPLCRFAVITGYTLACGVQITHGQVAHLRAEEPRTSWRAFWAATVAATALTVADIELSQACLRQTACTEVNPLLPRSHAAAYAIQLPLTAAGTWFGYHMKKHHQERWWLPQLGIITGHAIGVGSGVRATF